MALLALALLRNFPDQYSYFSTRSFSHRGSTFNSVNGFLVNYKGADGIKTGFTCAAGYNLVASAVRDGRRIVAVVLGETSRGGRAGTIAHLMDTAYAMPDPKPPVTIHDIDPARTDEPDLPADRRDLAHLRHRHLGSRVAQSTHRPKARSLEHRVRRHLQHQGQGADAARKLMRSHAAVLGGGMMTTIERGRKFRPIILNMDERQATSACKRLRQAKAYCVVVTPKNLHATIAKAAVKQRKSR